MRHALIRLIFSTIVLAIAACQGAVDNEAGGGTFISNPPTQPKGGLAPDFDEKIFETALDSPTDSDTSALVSSLQLAATTSGPSADWTSVFLEGPVRRMRVLRKRFADFAERIVEKVTEVGGEIAEPRVFTLAEVRLIDETRDWRVVITIPAEDLIRIAFVEADTEEVWGYYLIETVDDVPVRGVLAYVNPDTLGVAPASGVRFFGFAFDFTDESLNRLSATLELVDTEEAHYFLYQQRLQCEETSRDCIGEFVGITSDPPQRTFNPRSIRYAWNDESKDVCLAYVSYIDGVAALSATDAFVGPGEPATEDVVSGICAIATPAWDDGDFGPQHLPEREEDVDDGGYASTLFGDGTSILSWEAILGLDMIEDWLMGNF